MGLSRRIGAEEGGIVGHGDSFLGCMWNRASRRSTNFSNRTQITRKNLVNTKTNFEKLFPAQLSIEVISRSVLAEKKFFFKQYGYQKLRNE